MKKSIKIIVPILIISVVITAFVVMYFTIFKKDDKIKDFNLLNSNIVLEVGDYKNLNDCFVVTPSSASFFVMCYINDETLAEISENNIIFAKSAGETKIVIKCSAGGENIEEEINLKINEKEIIPSSFSFEHESITIDLTSTNATNKIITQSAYNVVPAITYLNSNICEYNYITGKITPISEGTTTITVTFSKNETVVSNSFTVNIQKNYRRIETDLTKEDENYILVLDKNVINSFELKVFENNILSSSVKLKLEFLSNNINANILQYESNVVILKASTNGEALLKVYCEDDESIFIIIKIRVS